MGLEQSEAYIGSPIQHVHTQGTAALHQRIAPVRVRAGTCAMGRTARREHPRLSRAADGFFRSSRECTTVATRDEKGFDDDDMARLLARANPPAPHIELLAMRRTTLGLLDTFVGKRISERILQGQVKRGDGEGQIGGVLVLDLRGFTALSETLPTDQLLRLLTTTTSIARRQRPRGRRSTAQFIGDAILIRVRDHLPARTGEVCDAALDAAIDGVAHHRRRQQSAPPLWYSC